MEAKDLKAIIEQVLQEMNVSSDEKAPAAEAVAAAVAAAPAVTGPDLSDDAELVAVMTAAIAAYEGSATSNGLVVRSIRRVGLGR